MNDLLGALSPSDVLRAIAIALLGLTALLAFLAGLLAGVLGKDREHRLFKISGGTMILMVAVVANHESVYLTGLFIGGLLIASENFMLFLAAVLNSNHEGVSKIAYNWRKMSQDNVRARQELEAERAAGDEDKDDQDSDDDASDGGGGDDNGQLTDENADSGKRDTPAQSTPRTVTPKSIDEVEKLVLVELHRQIDPQSQFIEQHVQVENRNGPVQYDAVIIENETNKIILAVEVKFQTVINPSRVERTLELIAQKYLTPDYPILIVFVFSRYAHSEARQLLDIKEKFNQQYPSSGVSFYTLDKGHLKSINKTDMKRLLPSTLYGW
ncbi:hypothetical protein JNJ66_06095 [Candidatus Saccharibacteria bacterium]|nr:hypothetical protein [Candidatus Saccharibacteria bacterium]